MSHWSAENASKAYLGTLNMVNRPIQANIDATEFISALAAGKNSKLMVVACNGAADSETLALVAAAHQTSGRVVCIIPSLEHLNSSYLFLGNYSDFVEFIVGDARDLLLNEYIDADFVLTDCCLEKGEEIFRGLNMSRKNKNGTVLGYNAFRNSSWRLSGIKAQFLPIGEGLLVLKKRDNGKSNWVVKVDKYTGEEHVFRIRTSQGNQTNA